MCFFFNFLIGFLLKKYVLKKISLNDLFCAVVIFISLTLCFFILIPVTVERSVSVFMLSEMEENDELYTKEDMEHIFVDKYIKSFGAFEKRFEEQIITGTIDKVDNEHYKINGRGKFIVNVFRIVAHLYNLDKRLVYPNTFIDN